MPETLLPMTDAVPLSWTDVLPALQRFTQITILPITAKGYFSPCFAFAFEWSFCRSKPCRKNARCHKNRGDKTESWDNSLLKGGINGRFSPFQSEFKKKKNPVQTRKAFPNRNTEVVGYLVSSLLILLILFILCVRPAAQGYRVSQMSQWMVHLHCISML